MLDLLLFNILVFKLYDEKLARGLPPSNISLALAALAYLESNSLFCWRSVTLLLTLCSTRLDNSCTNDRFRLGLAGFWAAFFGAGLGAGGGFLAVCAPSAGAFPLISSFF